MLIMLIITFEQPVTSLVTLNGYIYTTSEQTGARIYSTLSVFYELSRCHVNAYFWTASYEPGNA